MQTSTFELIDSHNIDTVLEILVDCKQNINMEKIVKNSLSLIEILIKEKRKNQKNIKIENLSQESLQNYKSLQNSEESRNQQLYNTIYKEIINLKLQILKFENQSDSIIDDQIIDLQIKIIQLITLFLQANKIFTLEFQDALDSNDFISLKLDQLYFKLKSSFTVFDDEQGTIEDIERENKKSEQKDVIKNFCSLLLKIYKTLKIQDLCRFPESEEAQALIEDIKELDQISFKFKPLIDTNEETEDDFKIEKVRFKSSIDVNNRNNSKKKNSDFFFKDTQFFFNDDNLKHKIQIKNHLNSQKTKIQLVNIQQNSQQRYLNNHIGQLPIAIRKEIQQKIYNEKKFDANFKQSWIRLIQKKNQNYAKSPTTSNQSNSGGKIQKEEAQHQNKQFFMKKRVMNIQESKILQNIHQVDITSENNQKYIWREDSKKNQYLLEQIMQRPQYSKERKLRQSLVSDQSSQNESLVKIKFQLDDMRKIGGHSTAKAYTQVGSRKNKDNLFFIQNNNESIRNGPQNDYLLPTFSNKDFKQNIDNNQYSKQYVNERNLKTENNNNVKSANDFQKYSEHFRFTNKSKLTNIPNYKDLKYNRYSTLNDHQQHKIKNKEGQKSDDADTNSQEMVNYEEIPINEAESRRSLQNDYLEELLKNFGQRTFEKVKKKFAIFSKNTESNLKDLYNNFQKKIDQQKLHFLDFEKKLQGDIQSQNQLNQNQIQNQKNSIQILEKKIEDFLNKKSLSFEQANDSQITNIQIEKIHQESSEIQKIRIDNINSDIEILKQQSTQQQKELMEILKQLQEQQHRQLEIEKSNKQKNKYQKDSQIDILMIDKSIITETPTAQNNMPIIDQQQIEASIEMDKQFDIQNTKIQAIVDQLIELKSSILQINQVPVISEQSEIQEHQKMDISFETMKATLQDFYEKISIQFIEQQDIVIQDLKESIQINQNTQKDKNQKLFAQIQLQVENMKKEMNENIQLRIDQIQQNFNIEMALIQQKIDDKFSKQLQQDGVTQMKLSDTSMNEIKKEGLIELSTYLKGYLQEWMDGYAINNFNQMITQTSGLKEDWVNLMNICSQMKYYSIFTIEKIVVFIKDKWMHSHYKSFNASSDSSRSIDNFQKFIHVSPYVLQLFDQFTALVESLVQLNIQKINQTNQTQVIQFSSNIIENLKSQIKVLDLLELFTFNFLNQILITKIKGPSLLIQSLDETLRCLQNIEIYSIESKEQIKVLKCKIIKMVLRCICVSLRQEQAIYNLVNNEQQILTQIIKIIRDQILSQNFEEEQEIIKQAVLMFRLISLCDDISVFTALDEQVGIKNLKLMLNQIILTNQNGNVKEECMFTLMKLTTKEGYILNISIFKHLRAENLADNQPEVQDKLNLLLSELIQTFNCDTIDQVLMALEKKYKYWNEKSKIIAIVKKQDEGNEMLPFNEYIKYIQQIHQKYNQGKTKFKNKLKYSYSFDSEQEMEQHPSLSNMIIDRDILFEESDDNQDIKAIEIQIENAIVKTENNQKRISLKKQKIKQ